MLPYEIFNLCPVDGRKSFYGKAAVIAVSGWEYLRSYNTVVAAISPEKQFFRMWSGYSVTTQRHVNAFRRRHGLPSLSKNDWLTLPLGKLVEV